MTPEYAELKNQMTALMKQKILEQEDGLEGALRNMDVMLLEVLREVGRDTITGVANELSKKQEDLHRADGFVVEERGKTPFLPSSEKSK